ncbi:MAG: hypothetical protein GY834_14165 [Bacteroidetes bacterium]|nr:hypothetical protein [Bacteroidota bacterium]
MDSLPCLGCFEFFIPRNKLQQYCSKPECQKTRKALWQRQKIKNDHEYRETQKVSNQTWLLNNPDYWKRYRQKNPEKTIRNRMLQRVRNRRQNDRQEFPVTTIIAKMDARKPSNIELEGGFWLVPTIAKMDAVKFYFHLIQGRYT